MRRGRQRGLINKAWMGIFSPIRQWDPLETVGHCKKTKTYLLTLYTLMMAHYASFNVHFVMVQDKQYFQRMERLLTKQQLSFETNNFVCVCVSRTCTNEVSLLHIRDVEASHVGRRHALREGGQAPPLPQPIREPWQVAVTMQVVGVQTATDM